MRLAVLTLSLEASKNVKAVKSDFERWEIHRALMRLIPTVIIGVISFNRVRVYEV